MNKMEGLAYLITREIKDRAQMEDFSLIEYRELLRKISGWCIKELRGEADDQDHKRRSH